VRGGRSKRFFEPKPLAVAAVRQAIGQIDSMAIGLEEVLKPR